MGSDSTKFLIILQALFFGTVIRAGLNKSVDPLIERLSAQQPEPLGWLKRTWKEEDKPRASQPASSVIVKSPHKLERKHKVYISPEVRATKLLRINRRAAPFTEKQLDQLSQEQLKSNPGKPNKIADDHEEWPTPFPQPERINNFDILGESLSTTSFTQQEAQGDETEVSSVPNSNPQADSKIKSYDGRLKPDFLEGAIEAFDQEAHSVDDFIRSDAYMEGSLDLSGLTNEDCDESCSIKLEPQDSDKQFNSHSVDEDLSSPRSSRDEPHAIVNETIPKSEQVSTRGVAGVINGTNPVVIPSHNVLPPPVKIPLGKKRYEGGGTPVESPWLCNRAYNPTLAGCVE